MNRTDWIGWAFSAKHPDSDGLPGEPLNAGEKLVLVYLAAQAGADGLARLDRDALAKVTDYEPRSLQRILKSLRDAGLLIQTDSGWYGLGAADAAGLPPAELLEVTLTRPLDVRDFGARPDPVGLPVISQAEADAAGETIAEHVNEAADRLMVRLNDVSLRLLGGMERLVLTLDAPPPPPPPDPVLEAPLYRQLLELGVDQDVAYSQVQKKLAGVETHDFRQQNADPAPGHTRSMRSPEPVPAAAAGAHGAQGGGGASTPLERFHMVWNILHDKPPTPAASAELFALWERLEEAENKHSVPGETVTAFEQLYPAILSTARAQAGRMPMSAFITGAPWDRPAVSTGPGEQLMASETARMLQDIARANHPKIEIGPPTTERDEDTGATRTESTHSYYLRVKRVHQQLLQWQQMTQE